MNEASDKLKPVIVSTPSGGSAAVCIYCGQPNTDKKCDAPNGVNHYHENCVPIQHWPKEKFPLWDKPCLAHDFVGTYLNGGAICKKCGFNTRMCAD